MPLTKHKVYVAPLTQQSVKDAYRLVNYEGTANHYGAAWLLGVSVWTLLRFCYTEGVDLNVEHRHVAHKTGTWPSPQEERGN